MHDHAPASIDMKIYGDLRSGNCLKVKYTADHLGLPYTWVPIDIMNGESRTPEYLARHPMGQVPAIELGDERASIASGEPRSPGRCLAQSNAIIRYLAAGTELLPDDRFEQAKVDEMLFWEQYSHEPYVAVCRFHVLYQGRRVEDREAWRVERGEQALDYLDRMLQGREWLVAERMTVADIALLAYSRLAGEGGFDLGPRPSLRRWIRRCEQTLRLT